MVNNRIARAQYITSYVQELQQSDPDARVGILGDFNDADGSAVQTIYATGALSDLNQKEDASNRYTYVSGATANRSTTPSARAASSRTASSTSCMSTPSNRTRCARTTTIPRARCWT